MEVNKIPLSIIDANVNRAKEGLRVVEDITRFVFMKKKISSTLKKIRHTIDASVKNLAPDYNCLLKSRNSAGDVGRKINSKTEFKRKSIKDVLISNFKRAEESLRVLEEISKLKNARHAKKFKELRYKVYETEKNLLLNLRLKNEK